MVIHFFTLLSERSRSEWTPIWTCLDCHNYRVRADSEPEIIEILTALLCHGADPTTPKPNESTYYHNCNSFEHVVKYYSNNFHGLLFNYMIDDYTIKYEKIHLEIILILGYKRSALFRDTVEHTKDMIVNGDVDSLYFPIVYLFTIDADYLDFLIKKCPDAIREFLSKIPCCFRLCTERFIENANMLLETDLKDDTIDFLLRFEGNFFSLTEEQIDESAGPMYVSYYRMVYN